MGRKYKPLPDCYADVLSAWQRGELSECAAARVLGVAPATFRAWRGKPIDELIAEREGWIAEAELPHLQK